MTLIRVGKEPFLVEKWTVLAWVRWSEHPHRQPLLQHGIDPRYPYTGFCAQRYM
jgi:hypothetical protein